MLIFISHFFTFQTYRWAIKDCSKMSIARVQHLCKTNQVSVNVLLDVMARSVEKNPCNRKNWSRLANTLGAVGVSSDTGNIDCFHDCNALHSGLHVCHASLRKQAEGQWWWGKDRLPKWEKQFFQACKSSTAMVKPEFISMVLGAIRSTRLPVILKRKNTRWNATNLCEEEINLIDDPMQFMGWLNHPISDDGSTNEDVTDGAVLLPQHISGILRTTQNLHPISSHVKESEEQLSEDQCCEALCMKIVVAFHLLGAWHPFVCNSVWWLAVRLWQSQQPTCQDRIGGVASHGLHWLSLHGLNISAYLYRRMRQP